MENESTVDYLVICSYCNAEYSITEKAATETDWDDILQKIGKTYGWCGKCVINSSGY